MNRKVYFPVLLIVFAGLTGMNILAGDGEKYFAAIDGWEKPDEADVYNPDNLFDIINGAAEVFLAYDFQSLYWGEYINSSDNDVYIVLEVYRQGDPINAFGVYSQERPRSPELIDIGAQGYTLPGVVHFFVADCYVKIRSHDRSEETARAMQNLARKVSEAIDPNPSFPKILTMLPEDGKISFSEQFINTNFLGHPFLSRALVSTYEVEGQRFNLFMIQNEDREKCREMLVKYYEFSRQEAGEPEEGIHRVNDRWNGPVGIVWQDNSLFGYYNLDNSDLQDKYLKLFSGR